MYSGRRDFRVGAAPTVLVCVATALFAGAAFASYRVEGWTWVSIGLSVSAVLLGGGGIVESLVLRIQLTDAALVVTDLRGRKSYPIETIERVEEALLLKNGRWVKLPSVGASLGNSVRAWLKAVPAE
jgi:hypothetical protein